MLALLASMAIVTVPMPDPPDPSPAPRSIQMRAYMTAARLEPYCTDTDPDNGNIQSCLGYLAGAMDQLLVMDALSPKPELCLPQGTELSILREAFLARLRAHPEERVMPAPLVADAAIVPLLSCTQLAKRPG